MKSYIQDCLFSFLNFTQEKMFNFDMLQFP